MRETSVSASTSRRAVPDAQPLGAQADLRRGLLGARIEDVARAGGREPAAGLEEQRGLADARLAPRARPSPRRARRRARGRIPAGPVARRGRRARRPPRSGRTGGARPGADAGGGPRPGPPRRRNSTRRSPGSAPATSARGAAGLAGEDRLDARPTAARLSTFTAPARYLMSSSPQRTPAPRKQESRSALVFRKSSQPP